MKQTKNWQFKVTPPLIAAPIPTLSAVCKWVDVSADTDQHTDDTCRVTDVSIESDILDSSHFSECWCEKLWELFSETKRSLATWM